jgi:hypothetical protein
MSNEDAHIVQEQPVVTLVEEESTSITRREKNLVTHHEITVQIQKLLSELPTAQDVPRMAKKFELYSDGFATNVNRDTQQVDVAVNSDSQRSFVTSDDQLKLVYSLLDTMYGLLPETSEAFPWFNTFSQEVNIAVPDTLNQFLWSHFGEDHLLVRLLKGSQQKIIQNLLMRLKTSLRRDSVQFKDVQGAWKIRVYFPQVLSQSDTHEEKICLCHRRAEQVYERVADPSGKTIKNVLMFKFEWDFCIFYNPDGSIFDLFATLNKFIDVENGTDEINKHSEDKRKDAVTHAFHDINDQQPQTMHSDTPSSVEELLVNTTAINPVQIEVTPHTPDQAEPNKKKNFLGNLKSAIVHHFQYVSHHDHSEDASDDEGNRKKSPRSPRSPLWRRKSISSEDHFE